MSIHSSFVRSPCQLIVEHPYPTSTSDTHILEPCWSFSPRLKEAASRVRLSAGHPYTHGQLSSGINAEGPRMAPQTSNHVIDKAEDFSTSECCFQLAHPTSCFLSSTTASRRPPELDQEPLHHRHPPSSSTIVIHHRHEPFNRRTHPYVYVCGINTLIQYDQAAELDREEETRGAAQIHLFNMIKRQNWIAKKKLGAPRRKLCLRFSINYGMSCGL
jgi:hypothetical protein